jgi:hypothetical protein
MREQVSDGSADCLVKLFTLVIYKWAEYARAGNAKGGSITAQLTSCLTGLELAV